jgi:hypothetical protein
MTTTPVEITSITLEHPKRDYYEVPSIFIAHDNDSTGVDNPKTSIVDRVFNLHTLRLIFSKAAFIAEILSVGATLYTSFDSFAMGFLHTRKIFTLDYYTAFVTSNYKMWIFIYSTWVGTALFGGAANLVNKVINRRSWKQYCETKAKEKAKTQSVVSVPQGDNLEMTME